MVATIWLSIDMQLPPVSYVKSIDIYLLISFLFVVLALVEYTITLNLAVVLESIRGKKLKARVSFKSKKIIFISIRDFFFFSQIIIYSSITYQQSN